MVSFTPSTLFLAAGSILFGHVAQAAELTAPNWVIPANRSPYPAMAATVGDTLTFAWAFGTHDVWIYPSGTCDNTNAILVGNINDNPSTYTFTADQAGTTVTFACDIGSHCQLGMIMDVTVRAGATAPPIPEPTDAPVVPPTDAPVPAPTDAPVPAPTDAPVPAPTDAPVPAPTDAPVEEPDDEPVPEPTLPPLDGPFGRCFVCGSEDAQVTSPETIITLPPPRQGGAPFPVDCATLFEDGRRGLIPDTSCPFIADLAGECCAAPTTPTDAPTPGTTPGTSPVSTPVSTPATTPATTPAPTFGPFDSCSICGDDFKVINAGAEITVDGFGTFLCGELEATGLAGGLSPQQCAATGQASLESDNPCRCRKNVGHAVCDICPQGEIPYAVNAEVVLSPFETWSCGDLVAAGLNGELPPPICLSAQDRSAGICSCAPADYTCNVCGGDGTNVTMLYPEVNISIPEELGVGDSVNCGFLETAGMDGLLGPNECAAASPLVQSLCGCAPIGYTCNICGQDSGMTISEVDVAFIPGDETTCSQAQTAGLSGGMDPFRCEALTPLAQSFCGCVEGGTLVPVVQDETEPPVVQDETEPPAVDTNATEPPVDPEDPRDETGTATGVEGNANSSNSGSTAVSYQAAMAVSSFVGLVVSLIV